jgi:hypothetical protein
MKCHKRPTFNYRSNMDAYFAGIVATTGGRFGQKQDPYPVFLVYQIVVEFLNRLEFGLLTHTVDCSKLAD